MTVLQFLEENPKLTVGECMEQYARLKCKEQRKNCQRALCDEFGSNSQNYEQTINNGSINAPEPV